MIILITFQHSTKCPLHILHSTKTVKQMCSKCDFFQSYLDRSETDRNQFKTYMYCCVLAKYLLLMQRLGVVLFHLGLKVHDVLGEQCFLVKRCLQTCVTHPGQVKVTCENGELSLVHAILRLMLDNALVYNI